MKVFIGFDSKETVAYHVLSNSILRHARFPVSITPLVREHLKVFFTRGRGPLESTDFSISRFLVPYLSGYQGYSVFMDCDMLMRGDIKELWKYVDDTETPLWVCQHDYRPKTEFKMAGQVQTTYPRKNWSSFMVFNNSRCRALSPDYVNNASGLDLHRFNWLKEGEEIGALPLEWNWLVGEYPENPFAKNYHYTLGGPWFASGRHCDHHKEWLEEYYLMTGQDYYAQQVFDRPPTLATQAKQATPLLPQKPWPDVP